MKSKNILKIDCSLQLVFITINKFDKLLLLIPVINRFYFNALIVVLSIFRNMLYMHVFSNKYSIADNFDAMYEFTDVCEYYFGRWGKYCSIIFSLLALLGAAIVYWVLMSNFLYNSGVFIHGKDTLFLW